MTEKNTRRRNAVIAAAAGAALLIGGSTYALWSASANITGGTITAGQLGLTAGTTIEYDVSADRTDSSVAAVKNTATTPATLTFAAGEAAKVTNVNATGGALAGHPIEIDTWMIVPGDTVAVTMPLEITLEGDNLVAALTLDTTDLVGSGITNTDMTYTYAIFDQYGAQIGEVMNLEVSQEDLLVALFQANGAGQSAGDDDTIDDVEVPMVETDGTANVTLVVFGHFAKAATTNMTAYDALGTIPATLTQVREGTQQFAAAEEEGEG